MDPEPSHIIKILKLLRQRGFSKEANVLEDLFSVEPPHKKVLVTDCPICGNVPDPNCVLCDGSGELSSVVADDEEDARITDELKLLKE
jgi:hypothetical protein